MREAPTVAVVPHWGWSAVVCTTHGVVSQWNNPLMAGFDALGHAAHHHVPHPPAGARCWWCTDPAVRYAETDGGGMVAACPAHALPG